MKTLNEEMKKIKRLFDYKNGEVVTESEDKKCDCGGNPCTCVEEGQYIDEDSEGEETFNYGEDEGEDRKEEESMEDHVDAIEHHLGKLKGDMGYDEDHEDRHEHGDHFRESFFPKGRSIRQKARVELMKRWTKIIK